MPVTKRRYFEMPYQLGILKCGWVFLILFREAKSRDLPRFGSLCGAVCFVTDLRRQLIGPMVKGQDVIHLGPVDS